ncbi:amidohydrolase family protein [Clostridium botulinum]
MDQILIKNGYIITMDSSKKIFEKSDILVEDSKIIAIGNVESELIKSNVEIIDANGKIIMPGLVNTHVHLSQQLARGLADDVDLLTWLRKRI